MKKLSPVPCAVSVVIANDKVEYERQNKGPYCGTDNGIDQRAVGERKIIFEQQFTYPATNNTQYDGGNGAITTTGGEQLRQKTGKTTYNNGDDEAAPVVQFVGQRNQKKWMHTRGVFAKI
jgi:hypothetical protein